MLYKLGLTIENIEEKMWTSLFLTLKLFVSSGGGDGDGWVISEFYREIADQFEKYEQNGDKLYLERIDNYDGAMIAFINDQESISFTNDRKLLPEWAGDIVVEI